MEKLNSYNQFQEYLISLPPMNVEKFLFDLFKESEKFFEVTLNPILNDRHIDIILSEKAESPIGKRTLWAVEIKSHRSPLNIAEVEGFYSKHYDLQQVEAGIRLLLISTSGFSKAAIRKAKIAGILLWGVSELYAFYRNTPIEMRFLKPPQPTEAYEISSKVEAFKKALKGIEPGKADWSKYQSLVIDILEFLLCPPLEIPKIELADRDKRNRRDIIFENASNAGFWLRVREIYQGHYVVVDAKNYTQSLSKRPILDISHYLKPYGCGMFAIIVSRKGYGAAGKHAAKEQWIGSKKLIISLSDIDLVKMLELKKEGAPSEDVIKEFISDFRMAL